MSRPINEQDEFLLSRLLDDDLSAEEASALRARLEREPDLQSAYKSLTRIDTLLTARRADQPQVDWARFHQQVMNQVEAEASHRGTIRLADFLRVALPLAAAAAIALIVWFWPHGNPVAPGPDTTPHVQVATAIQYHRDGTDNEIRVSYAQSEELSEDSQKSDHESESNQYILTRETKPIPPALLADASF